MPHPFADTSPRTLTAGRFLLLIGLIGAACLIHPRPLHAQEQPPVVAFYYAWFDWNTWDLPLSDQPVEPYLSADPATIEQHVLQAQRASIDSLILDWYGPQVENNQTETNLRVLLDKAQKYGLSAGLTVDIAGPFIQNETELVNALVVVRDKHTRHPAYIRVDGRPVVFFWRQGTYSVETWRSLRQQIDPNRAMIWVAEGTDLTYLEVFDGLYLYNVAWSDDPASQLIRWGDAVRAWSQQNGVARYWVATVMAGYDDRATGRADAAVRARNEGAYYRACWAGVGPSDADLVAINSFNEWLEGTQIEPTQSYGDFYLNLTAELVAQYRQSAVAPTATLAPTVTPTPTATLPPSPTVPPTPIPTETAAPTITPTATLTPTATPFRLPTPTAVLATAAPTTAASQPEATAADQATGPSRQDVTAIPSRHPIQGSERPRSRRACSLFPVALLFLPVAVHRLLRHNRRS